MPTRTFATGVAAGALAAVVVALSPGASGAQPAAAAPASSECVARQSANDAQEKRDSELVKTAVAAANQGGFPVLKPQVPLLEEVLGRAPASFETKTCDGATIVRSDSMAGMLLALLAAHKEHPDQRTVALGPSPYTAAALLVGSWYVENQDLPRAEAALSKGLALSPTNPKLTSEDALVLSRLGRPADALAVCDRTLNGNPFLDPTDHARILRARGYALGELNRFDEAEAAYQESLKYQPNHAGALNELKYLAQRKAGAPETRTVIMNSHKAKDTPPGS